MYFPSKADFIAMCAPGKWMPVYRELLADMETPVSAFRKLGDSRYAFLLESVEGGESVARYSFLGTAPRVVMKSKGREVTFEENGSATQRILREGEDPLHVLEELLGQYTFVTLPPHRTGEEMPRFWGGAVGYLGYDMVRFFEGLPDNTLDDTDLPDAQFMLTDTLLIFDHVKHRIKVLTNAHVTDSAEQAYDEAVARIDAVVAQLKSPAQVREAAKSGSAAGEFASNFSRGAFEEAVRTAKEYIVAGDIFQVVLSQRLRMKLTADRFDVYRALRSVNPSPYMYYLSFADLHLIGSSPEILVTEDRGVVRTRPLAGTRRRGKDAAEDKALEQELLADAKECAEHIMLVDLGRNDIGRVCIAGSVVPTALMQIERYSHVMHIYSDVVGALRPDRTQFDVLRACFPAGTVSGAPKIRAMEIIDELEPTRRGPYAGAIGYFGFSGNMDTCITIRTIVVKGDTAYIQAGAGIVADSVPEREYEETMNKARALLRAIEMAEEGLE